MIITKNNVEVILSESIKWKTQKKIDALLYKNAKSETRIGDDGKKESIVKYDLEAINQSDELLMLDMIESMKVDGKGIEVTMDNMEEHFDTEIVDEINENIAKIRKKKEADKKK